MRNSYFNCLFLLVILLETGQAIRWLALQHADIQWTRTLSPSVKTYPRVKQYFLNTSPCLLAQKRYGLSKQQMKFCQSTPDAMPFIQKTAVLTCATCKSVFQNRRWNCSSVDSAPQLTPDLTRATREQAYVYAVSSAALAYTIAQACTTGSFYYCSCANHPKELPNGNFKWGGCGDNVKWGVRFSRRFIDATEKRNTKEAASLPQNQELRHESKKQRAATNLHNSKVGRRVVQESLTVQCKCHGVSGSCSIKTCWRALPSMIEIGKKLLRRYNSAIEISQGSLDLNRRNLPEVPGRKSPTINQLVYLTKSPDYCTKDEKLGSYGTTGRKCNITTTGSDSCAQLCCGRGHRMIIEERLERCHCKYYYCCYVRCKTCRTFVEVYECL